MLITFIRLICSILVISMYLQAVYCCRVENSVDPDQIAADLDQKYVSMVVSYCFVSYFFRDRLVAPMRSWTIGELELVQHKKQGRQKNLAGHEVIYNLNLLLLTE